MAEGLDTDFMPFQQTHMPCGKIKSLQEISKDQLTLSPRDSCIGVKPTSREKGKEVLIHCLSLLVFQLCFKSLGGLKEKCGHGGHVSFVSAPLPSSPKGIRVLGALKTLSKGFLASKVC